MLATTTWVGASQAGNWPAWCSIRMPRKRSIEPTMARCSMTGCFFWLFSSTYSAPRRPEEAPGHAALHRADDGAVQHDRVLLLAVLVHVLGAQAARHHEVDLHGAQLPGTADGVLQVVLDLRAIEGTLARQLLPFHATGGQCRAQRAFGLVPGGVVTQPRFRAQGDLDLDLVEAEVLVNRQRLLVEGRHFRLDLVFRAEHVAVVLGEATHAQDAVQRAGRLVAVAGTKLTIADRQVAVAVQALVEHLDVARAVHRLCPGRAALP